MLLINYFFIVFSFFLISDKNISHECSHELPEEIFFSSEKKDDIIAWAPDYQIKWNDFKAKPQKYSTLDAYTMLGISLEVVSQDNGNVEMGVFGYFEKNKSWVKTDEQSDHLLKHERKHFDLCEVYRRILVKRLEDANPYAFDDFNKKVGEIFNSTFSEYTQEQERYDKETNHSQKKEKQLNWDETVVKRLESLKDYEKLMASLQLK